jgi:hypothetical protein
VTILESVSRTGRLVVVDEDYQSFGLSGEIAAKLTDVDPGMLRAGRAGGQPWRAGALRPLAGVRRAAAPGAHRNGDPARHPPMTEVQFPALSRESATAEVPAPGDGTVHLLAT